MIMAPFNSEVDKLNDEILEMFDEEERIYDRYVAASQSQL